VDSSLIAQIPFYVQEIVKIYVASKAKLNTWEREKKEVKKKKRSRLPMA